MGLANYFSKDFLAFSQVFKSANYSQFESILNSHVVELAFDDSIVKGEGRVSIELAISLLSRLYPRLKITDLSGANRSLVENLSKTALAINSNIELTNDPSTIALILGLTKIDHDRCQPVYIGSDNWIAKLSLDNPTGSANTGNPLAAGASVCIGLSNVFKFIFKELIDECSLDNDINLSLINFSSSKKPQRQEIGEVDISDTKLVGFGAIGNGFVWALSNLPDVSGEIIIIDPETIEPSNMQRYCLIEEKHIDLAKVEVAGDLLKEQGINVKPFVGNWAEYLNVAMNWENSMVCVAVDSAKDRIAIQSSLPKHILNAYTESNLIGISRHLDFLETACLSCGFVPQEKVASYSMVMAENLKITDHERKVRDYLYYSKPVDTDLLKLVAKANSVEEKELQQYAGMNLSNFYTTVVCGGYLLVNNESEENSIEIEAPLAFQSTLAGILLATELIIQKAGLREAGFKNQTHIYPLLNITDSINPYNHTLEKDKTGRCICSDADFKDIYKTRSLNLLN